MMQRRVRIHPDTRCILYKINSDIDGFLRLAVQDAVYNSGYSKLWL